MLQWIVGVIRRLFRDTRDPYRPGLDPFQQLDLEKLRARLRPKERGREAGLVNIPPTESESADASELEFDAYFVGELTTSLRICEDRLKAYSESIHASMQGGPGAVIDQIRASAVGDLNTVRLSGTNQLYSAQERTSQLGKDLVQFKQRKGITKAAIYPASRVLHVGFLAVLLVVEMVVNGYLFALGNEYGLLGGGLEALLFAAGNIALGAVGGGMIVLPFFYERSALLRFGVGLPSAAMFLALAAAYNLTVAHFRQALIVGQSDAARTAAQTLMNSPSDLDLIGLFLLSVGFAFCLLAAFDTFRMDDPHRGYGKLDRLVVQERQDYADLLDEEYRSANEIRDGAFSRLNAHSRDLLVRRQQQRTWYERSEALSGQFAKHREYLEATLRSVIAEYRDANLAARTTPPPAHFRQVVRLAGATLLPLASPQIDDSSLNILLEAAQAQIDQAHKDTVNTFDSIRAMTEQSNAN